MVSGQRRGANQMLATTGSCPPALHAFDKLAHVTSISMHMQWMLLHTHSVRKRTHAQAQVSWGHQERSQDRAELPVEFITTNPWLAIRVKKATCGNTLHVWLWLSNCWSKTLQNYAYTMITFLLKPAENAQRDARWNQSHWYQIWSNICPLWPLVTTTRFIALPNVMMNEMCDGIGV